MDYRKIAESIKTRIEKTHDREAYKDLLALCIGYESEDFAAAHQLNSEVRKMTSEALRNGNPKMRSISTPYISRPCCLTRRMISIPSCCMWRWTESRRSGFMLHAGGI